MLDYCMKQKNFPENVAEAVLRNKVTTSILFSAVDSPTIVLFIAVTPIVILLEV